MFPGWLNCISYDTKNKSVPSLDISNINLSGFLLSAMTELRTAVSLSVAGNSFSPEIHLV